MSHDKLKGPEKTERCAREKPLERRRRILAAIRKAAIDEFASKGLAGASTQAIAKRAGLSKPQLHYYISSKEELYEEILIHILNEWQELVINTLTDDEPAEVLRAYIHKKIEYGWKNPKVSRLFAAEIANGAPFLTRHWKQYQESMQKAVHLIQSWVDQALIHPVDPPLFLMHIWAVTQYYSNFEIQVRNFLQLRSNEEFDMARVEREVTSLFLRACGLQSSGTGSRAGITKIT